MLGSVYLGEVYPAEAAPQVAGGSTTPSDADTATAVDDGTVVAVTTPLTLRVPGHTLRGTHQLRALAGTVAITDTETATATDTNASLVASLTDPDTAAAVDAQSIAATVTDPDTGTVTEGAEAILAALTDADTATGVDGGESIDIGGGTIAKSDSDSASAADAEVSIGAGLVDTDTGTATDGGENIVQTVPGAFQFTPPTEDVVPPIAFDVPHNWNRLMRHFPNRKRGRAIWKLVDDSYTYTQPYPTELANARTTEAMGSNQTITATYKTVYLGGHTYTVDAAEAARIQAAITAGDIDGTLVPV